MESIDVAGKILSQSHDVCHATIGPVEARMSREELQEMVGAVEEIEGQIGASPLAVIGPSFKLRSGWSSLLWDRDRKCYMLNLRGVAWHVSRSDLASFIRDAAIPFLARGTTSKLLKGVVGSVGTGND